MGSAIQGSKRYASGGKRLFLGLFALGSCLFLSDGRSEPETTAATTDQRSGFKVYGLPDEFTKIEDSPARSYNEVVSKGMIVALKWLPGFISPGEEDEKSLYLCVAFANPKYTDYLNYLKHPGSEPVDSTQFYEVVDKRFYLRFEYLGDLHEMNSLDLTPVAKGRWIPGILLSFAAGPATANSDYFALVVRDGKLQCIFQTRTQDIHLESLDNDEVDEIIAEDDSRFEREGDFTDPNSKLVKTPDRSRIFKYVDGHYVVAERVDWE